MVDVFRASAHLSMQHQAGSIRTLFAAKPCAPQPGLQLSISAQSKLGNRGRHGQEKDYDVGSSSQSFLRSAELVVKALAQQNWRRSTKRPNVIQSRAAVPDSLPRVATTWLRREEEQLEPLDLDFYRMGHVRSVRAFGVEFKEGPKGVGVYSALDIPFITLPRILMEIPVELMVSVSVDHPWQFHPDFLPIGHPLFDVIESTVPETEWDFRLACMLLLALCQKENFWYLYGDFLPPEEDCPHLLLATEEELEQLQDPYLAQHMAAQQERAGAFFKKHWQAAHVGRKVRQLCDSEERFRWALAQVWSRTLTQHCIFGGLRQDKQMLCPYADMLNHDHTATCFLRWHKAERMVQVMLKPGQAIKRGQELTLKYVPQQPNDALMRTYGFSITDNEWEGVAFSGRAKIHRDSFLSTFDIAGTFDDYRFDSEDTEPDDLRTGAMIAAARTLPTWHEEDLPPLPSEERAAAAALQDECQTMLDSYATTLEEDRKLLAREGSTKSVRWRAAVKYRMDRKLLLGKIIRGLGIYANSFC